MRIYLACTVRGDRASLTAVRTIASRLERHGHEVLTAHLLQDDVEESESRLSEKQVYERDVQWLETCDGLVAEASGSSYGVGFEVGYVLGRAPQTGQRVFLLYDERRRSAISRLIAGNDHPNCVTLAYSDTVGIEAFIDSYFGSQVVGSA